MTLSSSDFVYWTNGQTEETSLVNHLERIASIMGTLLLGISAYLFVSDQKARESRRARTRSVEDLEAKLKQAWAPYHNP